MNKSVPDHSIKVLAPHADLPSVCIQSHLFLKNRKNIKVSEAKPRWPMNMSTTAVIVVATAMVSLSASTNYSKYNAL